MQNNTKHYSQEAREQLMMPHATTFQAQLCNQTQGLALHRQYSEQTLNTGISQQSNYLLLN